MITSWGGNNWAANPLTYAPYGWASGLLSGFQPWGEPTDYTQGLTGERAPGAEGGQGAKGDEGYGGHSFNGDPNSGGYAAASDAVTGFGKNMAGAFAAPAAIAGAVTGDLGLAGTIGAQAAFGPGMLGGLGKIATTATSGKMGGADSADPEEVGAGWAG